GAGSRASRSPAAAVTASGPVSAARTGIATRSASVSARDPGTGRISVSKGTLDCSQSRGTWCTAPAALPRRAGSRSPVRGSADDSVQSVLELLGLVRRQLDDEAPAALQRDPHDDAAALLGDLHRTITGPRLHRRHAFSPFIGNIAVDHRGTREPVRDGG